MPPYNKQEDYSIAGAHGTIAEQTDEAYLDDRSDASDDIEKGRLKFPQHLYGRERELETLLNIYDDLSKAAAVVRTKDDDGGGLSDNSIRGWVKKKFTTVDEEKEEEEEKQFPDDDDDLYKGSRVVFLSGYSGIGKSALVNEFAKQAHTKYKSSDDDNTTSDVLYASGKYTEQSTASAPFSAISEVLEKLVLSMINEDSIVDEIVCDKVGESDLIGNGTEGNRILKATFPSLAPILQQQNKKASGGGSSSSATTTHPSMNAIKECTRELLSIICETLEHPLILFLDDLQWSDSASIEMLLVLLTCTDVRNVMFICSYRSNEVDEDHAFSKLMDKIVTARSGGGDGSDEECKAYPNSVERMDLFNLSPEAFARFIADSIKNEEDEDGNLGEGVNELSEAVYTKTMGNIFFTKQALEELVRKNVLFYDVMCFEWRFVVSKVELADHMSSDVVTMVKNKIGDMSADIQHLLIVMSYIPHPLEVPLLKRLLSYGEFSYEEGTIERLLHEASEEGMLLFSADSKCYIFAHDRIRQASLEVATEMDGDELVLHISKILQDIAAQKSEMEWCLYVAVDLLNESSDKTINLSDLVKLNIRVSRIARSRGSIGKENELLHNALKCLETSGKLWKEYDQTLELYNAVIVSDHSRGLYNDAKLAIEQVFNHAKSLTDKLGAHTYLLLCEIEEKSDYSQGLKDGLKILDLYGFGIPQDISKAFMTKEEMKLKMSLKNRSYSCLTKLPLIKGEPIFYLFATVQKYAYYTGNEKHVMVIAWKAIRHSIKKGMDRWLPLILAILASSYAKQSKVKTAQELANSALSLCDKVPEDVETCALTRMLAHGSVMTQLQPFSSSVETILQCHKDLKLVGGMTEAIFGSMLIYFETYFAAGLELGPLVESKLMCLEDLCRTLNSPGFLTTFQINRQYALNLRTRSDNPTEFVGEAFYEESSLSKMNDYARKMALRDSTSSRLQLAFVFWDEDVMSQMLERIKDYPLVDGQVARLHSRLAFTGLAAFALSQSKGNTSYLKLGDECLSHFAFLAKLGSVNSKPVHLFMLAMKSPSRKSFEKAIDACIESNMIHLEAMAKERYSVFLNGEKDTALANDYITSSFWLYQDWGAYSKALQLKQQNSFLAHSTRKKAESLALSTVTAQSNKSSTKRASGIISSYTFNSTLESRERTFVKR